MFIGRHYNTLEAKGRIVIPRDFRTQLASGGVITRGLDGCLFLFPSSSWQQLIDKLALLPLTNRSARSFIRLFVQEAVSLNLDSQGRTLLPEHLISLANLKKRVVIAGSLNRIEIWDQDNYHRHLDQLAMENDLDAKLEELGV